MTDPIVNAMLYLTIGGAIVAAIAIKSIGVIARERDAYRREWWRMYCESREQQVEIMQLRQKFQQADYLTEQPE